MQSSYDVVVAGGSISGLLCAREIASTGHSVLVVERGPEIGTPEHCGGLVSSSGLQNIGVIPFGGTFLHAINKARIISPDGTAIVVDATRQKVLAIDRRNLDKQAAHQAQQAGAVIKVMTDLREITDTGVVTGAGQFDCRIVVDARGAASLIQKDRTGMIPSTQYEVYTDWIEDNTIEVMPDCDLYPGFFAWIIPSGRGRGRVGVAGRGINTANALESILEGRGNNHSIIRKISAPIWVNGPIKNFVDGNVVVVGDAAGQAKPTTAGGIYSSGAGGMFAGRAISQYLSKYSNNSNSSSNNKNSNHDSKNSNNNTEHLAALYRKSWDDRFGREFEKQILARRVLERMDNEALNKMIRSVTPDMLQKMAENGDFDFHTGSIIRMLGIRRTAGAAKSMLGSEMRRLWN